eukprot:4926002-Alexandrium_andersonii.AAC.1
MLPIQPRACATPLQFLTFRFVGLPTVVQLSRFSAELRAKLAQIDADLGAATARVASVEAAIGCQAEVAVS